MKKFIGNLLMLLCPASIFILMTLPFFTIKAGNTVLSNTTGYQFINFQSKHQDSLIITALEVSALILAGLLVLIALFSLVKNSKPSMFGLLISFLLMGVAIAIALFIFIRFCDSQSGQFMSVGLGAIIAPCVGFVAFVSGLIARSGDKK